MNFKLEENYFKVFMMISITCLIASLLFTIPIREIIKDKKIKQMDRDTVKYYEINNEKYMIDSVSENGSITLKKANK